MVSDGGRLAYVSLPQEYAASAENDELCFTDHKDSTTDMCCPQESGHVHAHVHRGEIIEDILLEQVYSSLQADFLGDRIRVHGKNSVPLFYFS